MHSITMEQAVATWADKIDAIPDDPDLVSMHKMEMWKLQLDAQDAIAAAGAPEPKLRLLVERHRDGLPEEARRLRVL